MLYSYSKGGGYNESKGRKRSMQKMWSCMGTSQSGDQDLSEMQESIFRSRKGIKMIWIVIMLLCAQPGYAESVITEASYYTVASCMKESGQAIMANGRALDDNKLTAASWDYDFGTRLYLRNMSAGPGFGRTVTVICTDRGPAKRLYRRGRKIDLSLAAFRELCPDVRRGLIQVEITKGE